MNNQAFDSVKQLDEEIADLCRSHRIALDHGNMSRVYELYSKITVARGRRAAMYQRVMSECGALAMIGMRAREANKRERLELVRAGLADPVPQRLIMPFPHPAPGAPIPGLKFTGTDLAAPGRQEYSAGTLAGRNQSRREQVVKVQAQALALKYALTDEQVKAVEAFGLAMARC